MTHLIVFYNDIFLTHTSRRPVHRRDLKAEPTLPSVQLTSSLEYFRSQSKPEPPEGSQRELCDGRRYHKHPHNFMCLSNVRLSSEELSNKSAAQSATGLPPPLPPYGDISSQHTQSVGSLLDPALSRPTERKRLLAGDRTPSPRPTHPPPTVPTPTKTFYTSKATPGSKDSLCIRSDSLPNASDSESVSSHGFLARELVSIMASISIPNILKTSTTSVDAADDVAAGDTAGSAAVKDGADNEDNRPHLAASSMPSLVAGCRRRRHTTEGAGFCRGLPQDRLAPPSPAAYQASTPAFTKQQQQQQPMYADSSGYLTSQKPTESDLVVTQITVDPEEFSYTPWPPAHGSFPGQDNTELSKSYNFATVKQSSLQAEELLPYSDSPTPVNASLETVLDGLCDVEAFYESSVQVLNSPLLLKQCFGTDIRLECQNTLPRVGLK
ncbi:unnamed protein product [Dibothriocephalus latus]|uniref:Uncharacterized protein n=1 Tax=Dibothriocephalus latus TaxID=60516 RepID=A0A3P7LKC8_DIBLA|nr:unnamed protein product [Dibothriocephalus latus]